MIEEIWKEIPDYPDYQVSNQGRIKSLKFGKERILTPRESSKEGNYSITFCQNGKKKTKRVYKLMGETFLDLKQEEEIFFIPGLSNECLLGNLKKHKKRRRHGFGEWVELNMKEYPGILFDLYAKKFVVVIVINGNKKLLNWYETLEAAIRAYDEVFTSNKPVSRGA